MQISWITPFSLIDFPGEVSCILFTLWCNLRCNFCHNSEYVLPEKIKIIRKNIIAEKAIFNFLEKRKWLLTWVSICWWEPTIHKDLVDFCKKIKEIWYLVKLDTNGQKPEILKELIEQNLVDYIAMDIKHSIWSFSKIVWLDIDENPYLDSIKLIMSSDIDHEFRTTIIKWIHSSSDITNIAKYIKWAKKYCLQNYRAGDTLDLDFEWESFSEKELLKFKDNLISYLDNIEIRN
jgi:pyruvate formate lyase activating enzyme